jgi:HEAT repeat protein
MSKQVRIVSGILLAIALGVFLWMMLWPHEQVYQGKTLRVWLEHSIATGFYTTADTNDIKAIRQFGASAVPTLLKMARAKDSPLKQSWIKLMRAQKLIPSHLHTDEEYHSMACMGFYALGPAGKGAVPALIELLKTNNPDIRFTARDCLGNIGPEAKAAVPFLIQLMNETNRIVRWDATINLGRIHVEPEVVVPILMKTLNPTNDILSATIMDLGEFGESAKPAVPALLRYLNDTNGYIRYETSNALKQIDPKTAAKAGVK